MAAAPTMVDIDCPRPGCETRISVPLEVITAPPKPGAKPMTVNVRVRRDELSTRMVEHYRAAHDSTATVSKITVEGLKPGQKVMVRPERTFLEGSCLAELIGADLPDRLDGLYVAPALGVDFVEPFKVEIGDGRAEEGPAQL